MNVIFDLDGLMFDTQSVFLKAWDYAGEKIGIGKAGYMVNKTLGMGIVASYDIWVTEFGDKYDQEELRKYTREFLQDYYATFAVPIKKGLYNLLNYLKENNSKIAVASSSPRWEVEKHLNDAKITDRFSAIVCGDMVEKSKPAPDVYLKVCEILGVRPEECIALEDSKNGLLSAYRAGCKTIMVQDLWQADEETLKIIEGMYVDLDEVKFAFERGDI
jgi:HAD superfamily hydrolase (TIGR01509 family)